MRSLANYLIILLLTFTLTSCDIIGGIFKGGMWTGAIMVILVIGLVIFGFVKLLGKRD
ncbi:hypothetical protein [Arundinibacter roseus]|uniref:hypothetical protein n=1 Tax=Arundinibacter roseus TaxID=2070510 RepID=UPI001404CE7A|nr:hypothetical protein [Arundinibacter roseus]